MGHAIRIIALGGAALALQGCLAKTAYDVATLPVKVASSGVDMATTSQSEADQKRGRALRKAEQDLAKRTRAWEKECKARQARHEPCPPAPTSSPN